MTPPPASDHAPFPKLRLHLGALAAWLAGKVGAKIKDHRTGELLGRAFLISFGGRVLLLGYRGRPIVPVFIPARRVTYWRQTLGFRRHDEPDFPAHGKDQPHG